MRSTGRHRNRGGWNFLEKGDLCVIVNNTSDTGGPVYDVVSYRRLASIGSSPGGFCVIWSESGTAPAPYTVDAQAGEGAIDAGGGTSKWIQPQDLSVLTNVVIQARIKGRLLDTASPSGAKVTMFDLFCNNPKGSTLWGSDNTPARLNARLQMPDPVDTISAASQDHDMSQASAYASTPGWDSSDMFECWWAYNLVPWFQLAWNGSSATPSGIAYGLDGQGYAYVLKERVLAQGGRGAIIAGQSFQIPSDCSPDDIQVISTQAVAGE